MNRNIFTITVTSRQQDIRYKQQYWHGNKIYDINNNIGTAVHVICNRGSTQDSDSLKCSEW